MSKTDLFIKLLINSGRWNSHFDEDWWFRYHQTSVRLMILVSATVAPQWNDNCWQEKVTIEHMRKFISSTSMVEEE